MIKLDKEWYKSIGIWGGVIVFVGGGLSAIGLEQIGAPLIALGLSVGFVGIRRAQG